MKKILFAIAFVGFAFAQANAQNPAAVSTKKETTAGVQSASPAATTAKPAPAATAKPAKKEAPATVTNGKPAMHKEGAHGKKSKSTVKENKDAAKPTAPGTDMKK